MVKRLEKEFSHLGKYLFFEGNLVYAGKIPGKPVITASVCIKKVSLWYDGFTTNCHATRRVL
jgi:hypothetical protein